jgi:UDP-N-acetylmuramoyl-tripeptide--D-alanyl-D-alanine ligase
VRRADVGSLAGATVVDDTYNANPDSMRAAIDVLAAQAAPRVLVLGDMGEVGDEGPAFHREIGAYARERGIDALFALGDASRDACAAYGDTARHFGDVGALLTALLAAGYGARDGAGQGLALHEDGARDALNATGGARCPPLTE